MNQQNCVWIVVTVVERLVWNAKDLCESFVVLKKKKIERYFKVHETGSTTTSMLNKWVSRSVEVNSRNQKTNIALHCTFLKSKLVFFRRLWLMRFGWSEFDIVWHGDCIICVKMKYSLLICFSILFFFINSCIQINTSRSPISKGNWQSNRNSLFKRCVYMYVSTFKNDKPTRFYPSKLLARKPFIV